MYIVPLIYGSNFHCICGKDRENEKKKITRDGRKIQWKVAL